MLICRILAGGRSIPTSIITMTKKIRLYTMIAWMTGGRRAGPRPRCTSLNAINTFYNIEQGRVVDLFIPTSIFCTFAPNISPLVVIVAVMVHISNSPITANSISWNSEQSTTFILVRGVVVAGRRPISKSPFNINSCYPIARVRVAGILWRISTSINIFSAIRRGIVSGHTWPTSMTSAITWGRLAGLLRPMLKTFTTSTITWVTVAVLKRPMSTTFLPQRHFKNIFFGTFVVAVTTKGRRMAGRTILRS